MKSPFLRKAKREQGETLTVEIANLDPSQVAEFKRLFAWMTFLGGVGCSRQFTIAWDGDGSARARISVDGQDLKLDKDDQAEEDKSNYEKLRFSFE